MPGRDGRRDNYVRAGPCLDPRETRRRLNALSMNCVAAVPRMSPGPAFAAAQGSFETAGIVRPNPSASDPGRRFEYQLTAVPEANSSDR